MEGSLTALVVFVGILALTRSQNFDDSAQQFQTPQQFTSPQGRFPQQQGQQFQSFGGFSNQQNFNKAPDAGRIPNQRLRRPQAQSGQQVQRAQPIGSIPSPAPPPPPRAAQQFRPPPQFAPVQTPVPVQRQPVRQEFFDQPAPGSFPASAPPPPPPQPQPQLQQEFVPRPVATPSRIQEPFSTTKKTQKEIDEEYNAAILRQQAESAKYSFSASVSDGINDNTQSREEVRDGLKLTGMYSYSDGFYKRTITYEADENGYRVVNEDIEPLGDGPVQNPDGTAEVSSNVGGTDLRYTITSADIPARKPQPVTTNRSPQQTQLAIPSRQAQRVVDDNRQFIPSQPSFGREQQQFQGSQQQFQGRQQGSQQQFQGSQQLQGSQQQFQDSQQF